MGWLLVIFDLPTKLHQDKKNYTSFREALLLDGFIMVQFSVYARPCVTFARQETHMRFIKSICPPNGHIRACMLTNAQWEDTFIFYGKNYDPAPPPEKMMEQALLW